MDDDENRLLDLDSPRSARRASIASPGSPRLSHKTGDSCGGEAHSAILVSYDSGSFRSRFGQGGGSFRGTQTSRVGDQNRGISNRRYTDYDSVQGDSRFRGGGISKRSYGYRAANSSRSAAEVHRIPEKDRFVRYRSSRSDVATEPKLGGASEKRESSPTHDAGGGHACSTQVQPSQAQTSLRRSNQPFHCGDGTPFNFTRAAKHESEEGEPGSELKRLQGNLLETDKRKGDQPPVEPVVEPYENLVDMTETGMGGRPHTAADMGSGRSVELSSAVGKHNLGLRTKQDRVAGDDNSASSRLPAGDKHRQISDYDGTSSASPSPSPVRRRTHALPPGICRKKVATADRKQLVVEDKSFGDGHCKANSRVAFCPQKGGCRLCRLEDRQRQTDLRLFLLEAQFAVPGRKMQWKRETRSLQLVMKEAMVHIAMFTMSLFLLHELLTVLPEQFEPFTDSVMSYYASTHLMAYSLTNVPNILVNSMARITEYFRLD